MRTEGTERERMIPHSAMKAIFSLSFMVDFKLHGFKSRLDEACESLPTEGI